MSDADDPDLALASGAPPGLHVAEQPFSLAFHPANELLAVGLIDGTIEFHAFRSSERRPAASHRSASPRAPRAEPRAARSSLRPLVSAGTSER